MAEKKIVCRGVQPMPKGHPLEHPEDFVCYEFPVLSVKDGHAVIDLNDPAYLTDKFREGEVHMLMDSPKLVANSFFTIDPDGKTLRVPTNG